MLFCNSLSLPLNNFTFRHLELISCDADCGFREGCVLVLDNQERVSLTMEDFREAVGEVLRRKGYLGQEKVETVLWNPAYMEG